MSTALFLGLLISTILVGGLAFQAWRKRSTVIAGQLYTREDAPRIYWVATAGWTAAFVFMAYLAVGQVLRP